MNWSTRFIATSTTSPWKKSTLRIGRCSSSNQSRDSLSAMRTASTAKYSHSSKISLTSSRMLPSISSSKYFNRKGTTSRENQLASTWKIVWICSSTSPKIKITVRTRWVWVSWSSYTSGSKKPMPLARPFSVRSRSSLRPPAFKWTPRTYLCIGNCYKTCSRTSSLSLSTKG